MVWDSLFFKICTIYNNRVNEPNLSTSKERKSLVTYYKTYGIITLKKHVDAYCGINAKKFEEEINSSMKRSVKKVQETSSEKWPNVFIGAIFYFLDAK
jgi:hypothetical protein